MEKILLETVQWHTLNDIDEIAPINDEDYKVLDEIGNVLRKYGRTDRFGVCLLHKHFEIKDDELVFEMTNVEDRISTLKVEKKDLKPRQTIETMWRYGDDTNAVTKCEKKCDTNYGHKVIHPKVAR